MAETITVDLHKTRIVFTVQCDDHYEAMALYDRATECRPPCWLGSRAMILVDHSITERVRSGELSIANFDPASVQPASYDLRIGPRVYAPPQPEKAIDLSANGGAYRLPPYGAVAVETFEDLRLPVNILGRIGLKSSYARTGIVASVGPQIDPGFDGKLFISLFNLTAASHVLRYKDAFLTIEFHTLEESPDHGYSGPYQGKHSIGPEVLESLVKIEGVTLTQMHSQFGDFQSHVAEMRELMERFDRFIGKMDAQTAAILQLLKRPAPRAQSAERARRVRSMSVRRAADSILELFKNNRTLYYSDIADRLNISLQTAIQACELLEQQGRIQGAGDGASRPKRPRNRIPPQTRRRT